MTSDIDQKLSVLIVDDDAVDREAIKRYLKQSGGNFDFLDADSGNLGLEMSQGKKFDCKYFLYNHF